MTRVQVTAVVPVHNRPDFALRALRSILRQTIVPNQIVVVDDASTDDTAEVIEAANLPVELVQLPRNSGPGAARNAGVNVATNDLLAFLDSDDEWLPSKMARQLEHLIATKTEVSLTAVNKIDTRTDRRHIYDPARFAANLVRWSNPYFGGPSSLLITLERFEAVGGFPENVRSEDWLFFRLLHEAGVDPLVLSEPLVNYYVHSGGLAQQPRRIEEGRWNACVWLDERSIGGPAESGLRKQGVAATLALAYASGRDIRGVLKWVRIVIHQGRLRRVPRILFRVMRAALQG